MVLSRFKRSVWSPRSHGPIQGVGRLSGRTVRNGTAPCFSVLLTRVPLVSLFRRSPGETGSPGLEATLPPRGLRGHQDSFGTSPVRPSRVPSGSVCPGPFPPCPHTRSICTFTDNQPRPWGVPGSSSPSPCPSIFRNRVAFLRRTRLTLPSAFLHSRVAFGASRLVLTVHCSGSKNAQQRLQTGGAPFRDTHATAYSRPSSRRRLPTLCNPVGTEGPGSSHGCSLGNLGVCLKAQSLDHLPVNPGAQMHVPFSPSPSQVPPFRQLTLAQGSLYDSQCIPAEKDTKGVARDTMSSCHGPGKPSVQTAQSSVEADSWG